MAAPFINSRIRTDMSAKLGEHASIFDFQNSAGNYAKGDGVQDDAPFLQYAINSMVAAGGKELYIPGGRTYAIKSSVTTPTGDLSLTIYGDKQGTILQRAANLPIGSGMLNVMGSNLTIQDLLIDGGVTTTLGINYYAQSNSITGYAVVSSLLVLTVSSTANMQTGAVWNITGITGTHFTAGYYYVTVVDGTHFSIILPGGALGSYTLSSAVATTPGVADTVQPDLTANTSIWVGPQSLGTAISSIHIDGVTIQHTGGYAILFDARIGDIIDSRVTNCRFTNNRTTAYGISTGSLIYGSWNGGIHYKGDCETGAHYATRTGGATVDHLYTVKGLLVDSCTFSRCTGNQVWGHAYAYDTMHSNVRVTNNDFVDIGRDAVLTAVVSGGVVAGNTGRRIGYMCFDDTSAGTPAYLGGQYGVFLDTSGCQGVTYSDNSCISALGAFCDLDGFAYGSVSNNTFRVPQVGDFEYAEDAIVSWPGNFTYGVQTGNNYFNNGGINVNVLNNTLINCNYGGIRMFAARGCHVAGNTINHPAGAVYPPVMFGNFVPLNGAGQTNSYNNDVTNNNIQWNPTVPQAAIQEQENWSGGPLVWSGGQKNWIADNRLFGTGMWEFSKAPTSNSITGTVISSQGNLVAADSHVMISREQVSGVDFTSQYSSTGDLQTRFIDSIGQLNVSLNGVGGSLTTGVRAGALAVDDTVATSHLYADGFLAILGKTATGSTYSDANANLFNNQYGLIRFNESSHVFQISVNTTSGTRVWTSIGSGGSGTPGGSNQNVQYNDASTFGGDGNLLWDKVNKVLTILGTAGTSGVVATTFNSSATGTIAAVQTVGGTFVITGAGNAAFQSVVVGASRQLTITDGAGRIKGDTGGWAMSWGFTGSGGTDFEGFGALGGGNTLNNYYIGTYAAQTVTVNPTTRVLAVQNVVATTFNSVATGTTPAVQQYLGTFSITGAGNAAFQSVNVTNGVVATTFNSTATGSTSAVQTAGGSFLITGAGDAAFQTVSVTNIVNLGSATYANGTEIAHTSLPGYTRATSFFTGVSGTRRARWQAGVSSATETGSNTGSDYFIKRFDDAGNYIDTPLFIYRNTGVVTCHNVVSTLFNSVATGSAPAFQQYLGNFSITGAGDAAFQTLALTNSATIGNAAYTSNTTLNFDTVAGHTRSIAYYTGNGVSTSLLRWQTGVDAAAESGSNAGSDYFIARFNDAGIVIDFPLIIRRDTGVVTFNNAVSTLFNSVATGSAPAFQQYLGNFSISGAGDAAFQTVSLTNAVNIGNGAYTGDIVTNFTTTAGHSRYAGYYTGVAGVAKFRWAAGIDALAESGSNAGSNYFIQRYDDGGTFIDIPLYIVRSTGITTMKAAVINGSITSASCITTTFNSSATGSTPAITQGSGTFSITGAGDAAFQTVAVTNAVSLGNAGYTGDTVVNHTTLAGHNRYTAYYTGVSGTAELRWQHGVTATAESGSNSGSDYFFNRFNDAGGYIDTPLYITRSTGLVNMLNLTVSGTFTAGTFSATNITLSGNLTAANVIATTFNSSATGSTPAITQGSGTFSVSGAGDAAFQTVSVTNVMRLGNVAYTANTEIDFVSMAGYNRATTYFTGTGVGTTARARWQVGASNAAESGSNTGSDYFIHRFNDAGGFIDTPLVIYRNTGIATFLNLATVTANVSGTITSLNSIATTFNSSATGATFAITQGSGTFSITGAGDAAFQTVALTNAVSLGNATYSLSDTVVNFTTVAGHNRYTAYYTGVSASAKLRWTTGVDAGSESGGNAGSNYFIQRFNDAGTFIDTPLSISRSTGTSTFTGVTVSNTMSANTVSGTIVQASSVMTLGGANVATQSYVNSLGFVVGAKTSDLAATYSNSGGYIILSFINSSGAITCGALSTSGSVNAANYQVSGTNGGNFTFQDLAGVTHTVNHGIVTS